MLFFPNTEQCAGPTLPQLRVGPAHCSVFGKQVLSVRCSDLRRRRPFSICDDVLARSVQTAFRSEHWSEHRTLNTGPKFQWNCEISLEFEGSEAGIMKNLWKMKVLGGVAGRRRESLQGGETARPGSNIVENVRFGAPGPFPGPWRPMPRPGPSFWTLLAWSWDPKMRAGSLRPNLLDPTLL